MAFGEFERRDRRWDELPRVEVSQEQLEARLNVWIDLAKAHAGEPVLTYEKDNPHSPWFLSLGRVRSDLVGEEVIDLNRGVALVETPTATSDGRSVRESQSTMRVGYMEAYNSFQRKKAHLGDREGVPCFQIVFGNEAIADWFTKNSHLWAVDPSQYVQMANRIGIKPIVTPEIAASALQHKYKTITQLVKVALEQSGLTDRIDAVYKSIGSGVQSLYGGLAIGMAPESIGEANLRTYQKRQDRDRNSYKIEELKQELVDLGVEEADYYRSIAWLLGLDLPGGKQDWE